MRGGLSWPRTVDSRLGRHCDLRSSRFSPTFTPKPGRFPFQNVAALSPETVLDDHLVRTLIPNLPHLSMNSLGAFLPGPYLPLASFADPVSTALPTLIE